MRLFFSFSLLCYCTFLCVCKTALPFVNCNYVKTLSCEPCFMLLFTFIVLAPVIQSTFPIRPGWVVQTLSLWHCNTAYQNSVVANSWCFKQDYLFNYSFILKISRSIFLPNPHDGSLYAFGSMSDGLKVSFQLVRLRLLFIFIVL